MPEENEEQEAQPIVDPHPSGDDDESIVSPKKKG